MEIKVTRKTSEDGLDSDWFEVEGTWIGTVDMETITKSVRSYPKLEEAMVEVARLRDAF
jgi:hypothetical protein